MLLRREEQEEKVRILTEEIQILRKQVRNPHLLPSTLEHKESDLRWQIEKMVYDEMINHVWSWGYLGPFTLHPSTEGEWFEVADWNDGENHSWRDRQRHNQVFDQLIFSHSQKIEQWACNLACWWMMENMRVSSQVQRAGNPTEKEQHTFAKSAWLDKHSSKVVNYKYALWYSKDISKIFQKKKLLDELRSP